MLAVRRRTTALRQKRKLICRTPNLMQLKRDIADCANCARRDCLLDETLAREPKPYSCDATSNLQSAAVHQVDTTSTGRLKRSWAGLNSN